MSDSPLSYAHLHSCTHVHTRTHTHMSACTHTHTPQTSHSGLSTIDAVLPCEPVALTGLVALAAVYMEPLRVAAELAFSLHNLAPESSLGSHCLAWECLIPSADTAGARRATAQVKQPAWHSACHGNLADTSEGHSGQSASPQEAHGRWSRHDRAGRKCQQDGVTSVVAPRAHGPLGKP